MECQVDRIKWITLSGRGFVNHHHCTRNTRQAARASIRDGARQPPNQTRGAVKGLRVYMAGCKKNGGRRRGRNSLKPSLAHFSKGRWGAHGARAVDEHAEDHPSRVPRSLALCPGFREKRYSPMIVCSGLSGRMSRGRAPRRTSRPPPAAGVCEEGPPQNV